MLTLPARSDLTSVPVSSRPASRVSRMKYSWKAARLLATFSSPSLPAWGGMASGSRGGQAAAAAGVVGGGHGPLARGLDGGQKEGLVGGHHRDAIAADLQH